MVCYSDLEEKSRLKPEKHFGKLYKGRPNQILIIFPDTLLFISSKKHMHN